MALRKYVKYQNRKMHEIGSYTYVSVDDVGDAVAAGDDVEVIDDATGEDVTVAVLARSLYNRCLSNSTTVEVATLNKLIRDAAGRQKAA